MRARLTAASCGRGAFSGARQPPLRWRLPRHVGIRARARCLTNAERLTDDASLIRNVREARRWRRDRFGAKRGHVRLGVDDARFRIGAGARPVRSAARVPQIDCAEQPVDVADDRRVVKRAAVREVAAPLVVLHVLDGLRAHVGSEVDQFVGDLQTWTAVRRRLARNRLRRRIPLTGHVALRYGGFDDRPDRLAGHAIEDVEERLLRRLRDELRIRPSIVTSSRIGADEMS